MSTIDIDRLLWMERFIRAKEGTRPTVENGKRRAYLTQALKLEGVAWPGAGHLGGRLQNPAA